MSVVAGTQSSGDVASNVLDNNTDSIWHSDWSNSANTSSRDNHHLTFTFNEATTIDGIRYLQRQGGGKNGALLKIDLFVSTSDSGNDWEQVIDDGVLANDAAWQMLTFEEPQAKRVKLQVVDAMTDQPGNLFASAAEIRFTEVKTVVEECKHTETTVTGKVDATCTADGYTGDTVCSDCGETVEAGKGIAAKGHTEVTVAGKEATCTATGLTEGKKCSVCGTVTVVQKEIPAKGHTFGEWTVVTAPTTEAQGLEKRVCACGEKEERAIAKLPEVPEVVDKTALEEYIEACEEYYEEADYTAESWAVYAAALAEAESVLADEDATKQDVAAAVAALEAAAEALAQVEPEQPVDPEKPGTDDEEDNKDEDKEEDKSPVTGDTAMVVPMAVLMMACAAIVVILKKRLTK